VILLPSLEEPPLCPSAVSPCSRSGGVSDVICLPSEPHRLPKVALFRTVPGLLASLSHA